MNLPKKFNPEMFDEPANLKHGDTWLHDFEVEIECMKRDCRNPAHHRLIDPVKREEVTDTFERIEAMRELWHGGK